MQTAEHILQAMQKLGADLLLTNNISVLESRMKLTFHVRFGGGALEKCQMTERPSGNSPYSYPTSKQKLSGMKVER